MKKRKVPMRKDVVSGEMAPKKKLVRIVRNKQGEVAMDPSGKKPGRGAYVAIDVDSVKKAKATGILQETLNVELDDQFFTDLLEYVEHEQARQELIDNGKL